MLFMWNSWLVKHQYLRTHKLYADINDTYFLFFNCSNTLRMTRSAALEGIGSASNNNTFLGKPNKDFDFADISPLKIDFAECSALNKEDSVGLTQIYEWLEKIA